MGAHTQFFFFLLRSAETRKYFWPILLLASRPWALGLEERSVCRNFRVLSLEFLGISRYLENTWLYWAHLKDVKIGSIMCRGRFERHCFWATEVEGLEQRKETISHSGIEGWTRSFKEQIIKGPRLALQGFYIIKFWIRWWCPFVAVSCWTNCSYIHYPK